ncbi:MAG: hypothetical protein GXO79_11875 [Chlorobi bacterium]|nr:hypothetical protein [Chlorobiota bacterium]
MEKDANANFKNLAYDLALEQYLELLPKDTANIEYNYKIGICYLNLDLSRDKALPYLLYASKKNYDKSDLSADVGVAYFYSYQFEKAINILNSIKQKENISKEIIQYVDTYIQYAKNAISLMKNPENVTFNNLGKFINSEKSDFNPFLNNNDNILFYTSNRIYNSLYKTYTKNVYYSVFDRNSWKRSKTIGSVINSSEDETVTGISYNNDLLFTQLRRFDVYDDIYVTHIKGTRFKGLESLGSNINSKAVESGVTISLTGDTLIFASNRAGGFGGLDLYLAHRLPDGQWSEPQNLGANINTRFDEDYPIFSTKGSKLYFASKGYNTMGGYDLFYSSINSKSFSYNKPVNLGFPINSIYDDKTITFSKDGRYAFKAAIRPEGLGSYDIYQIVFNDVVPNYTIFKGIVKIENSDSTFAACYYNKNLTILVNKEGTENNFGKYSVNNKTGSYLIALPPGRYNVKLNDTLFKNQILFTIPEMNANSFVIQRNITFKLKE